MACLDFNATEWPSLHHYAVFSQAYRLQHGNIAAVLCVSGVCVNACQVLVLTKTDMISTVNAFLTSIALCDSLLMATYLVYLCHYRLATYPCPLAPYTHGWAVFSLIYANLSVGLRASSLWLSVVMAALRCKILNSNQPVGKHSEYGNFAFGIRLILSTVVLTFIASVPIFLNNAISSWPNNYAQLKDRSDCPKELYDVTPPEFALKHDCFLMKLAFWTNGLFLKLLPCALLGFYIWKLLNYIKQRDESATSLLGGRESSCSLRPTTLILTAILITMMLCELPNALASILTGARSLSFSFAVYKYLGDIFDLLSLISCISTFVMYCSMSRIFRETFVLTLKRLLGIFDARQAYRRWSTVVTATDLELHSINNRIMVTPDYGARSSTVQQHNNIADNGTEHTVAQRLSRLGYSTSGKDNLIETNDSE